MSQATSSAARAARLVVLGRDKHPARYMRLAQRAGVADHVAFAGPQADPRPWYGAGERVRDFGAGTTCDAGEVDAIAAAMRELMDEAGRAGAGSGRPTHPPQR